MLFESLIIALSIDLRWSNWSLYEARLECVLYVYLWIPTVIYQCHNLSLYRSTSADGEPAQQIQQYTVSHELSPKRSES